MSNLKIFLCCFALLFFESMENVDGFFESCHVKDAVGLSFLMDADFEDSFAYSLHRLGIGRMFSFLYTKKLKTGFSTGCIGKSLKIALR